VCILTADQENDDILPFIGRAPFPFDHALFNPLTDHLLAGPAYWQQRWAAICYRSFNTVFDSTRGGQLITEDARLGQSRDV
jgi:hypothetical protein